MWYWWARRVTPYITCDIEIRESSYRFRTPSPPPQLRNTLASFDIAAEYWWLLIRFSIAYALCQLPARSWRRAIDKDALSDDGQALTDMMTRLPAFIDTFFLRESMIAFETRRAMRIIDTASCRWARRPMRAQVGAPHCGLTAAAFSLTVTHKSSKTASAPFAAGRKL